MQAEATSQAPEDRVDNDRLDPITEAYDGPVDDLNGYRVCDDDDDDPVLLQRDGSPVDTWREDYPYDERMDRAEYDREQAPAADRAAEAAELGARSTGERIVILFEGRDAAGKGGTIKRFMEHLNPRGRPRRGAGEADRAREHPVVLPALHQAPAGRRRDRALRPVLVQPGRASSG